MPATRSSKDGAMTPAAEAVRVPARLAPPGPPQAKQLRPLHAQPSLGQTCHRQKSCVYARTVTLVVSDSAPLWTVARQASLSGRGVLQARILERIGQCWLPHPSRALYVLLPELPLPPSQSLVLPEPLGPQQPHTSTPGPHWGRPKSSRAASGANPSGRSTCRGGNKTTIETQGQCG